MQNFDSHPLLRILSGSSIHFITQYYTSIYTVSIGLVEVVITNILLYFLSSWERGKGCNYFEMMNWLIMSKHQILMKFLALCCRFESSSLDKLLLEHFDCIVFVPGMFISRIAVVPLNYSCCLLNNTSFRQFSCSHTVYDGACGVLEFLQLIAAFSLLVIMQQIYTLL